MPVSKVSKDKVTLLLGANIVGDFKFNPMLIFYSGNCRALKNYAKSTLPVLCKQNSRAWVARLLLATLFTKYFKPAVKNYCSEKRSFLWKYHCLLTLQLVTQELWRSCMSNAFVPANTTSILRSIHQGVILTFKFYYLRNTVLKAIVATTSDSSDKLRQN